MPSATTDPPQTRTAIVATGPGQLAVSHDILTPMPGPNQVLIRTRAVALNPADAKMVDFSATVGAINGYDLAGEIVALGPQESITNSNTEQLAIGDRVSAMVHGMNALNPSSGAFASYVVAPSAFVIKLPDSLPYENGAALGTSVATVGLALFQSLKIPATPESPAAEPFYVLVYGASTATGTMALQILRLANLKPIAVCSAKNFPLAKEYGAEEVFDYTSPTCAADIRKYTKNTCKYALDCITDSNSMELCYGAIGRAGGRYCGLEPYPERMHTRMAIKPDWIMGLTIFGKRVALEGAYGRAESVEDRVFGEGWFRLVGGLVREGRVRSHPVVVLGGGGGEKGEKGEKGGEKGWEGVIEGVERLRRREVSGEKLVYLV